MGKNFAWNSDSAPTPPLGEVFCAEVVAEVLFCSAMDVLLYMVCRSPFKSKLRGGEGH